MHGFPLLGCCCAGELCKRGATSKCWEYVPNRCGRGCGCGHLYSRVSTRHATHGAQRGDSDDASKQPNAANPKRGAPATGPVGVQLEWRRNKRLSGCLYTSRTWEACAADASRLVTWSEMIEGRSLAARSSFSIYSFGQNAVREYCAPTLPS